MKKLKTAIVMFALILCCAFVMGGCGDEKVVASHEQTYYLADTVARQASVESPDGSETEQKAVFKGQEKIGDIMFMDFYIGQVMNCFVQQISDSMYNDIGLKSFKFTKKETTGQTISQGISNSISTTDTVSMTDTSTKTVSWKFGDSKSLTLSAEMGINVGIYSAKASASTTVSSAYEYGTTHTSSTAETIAESVTKQTTDNYSTSQIDEASKEMVWEYDMQAYEKGYYYTLALVTDVDVHQIVAYNVETGELFTTYFMADLNSGNEVLRTQALRMLSSESTSFPISEEYRLSPITEVEIEDEIIDVNPPKPSEGTAINPYMVSNEEDFKKLKENTSQNTYFKLANSIELPAWNAPFEFTGHLDGNGKKITYYQTVGSAGNKGLFSRLISAEVTNLYVDAHISDGKGDGTYAIGGLAGKTEGRVDIFKVSVSGSIVLNDGVGLDYIGGVVGQFLGGTIEQCSNSALVETHAYTARAGGIAGYTCPTETYIKISDCYNVGVIKACTAYIYGGRSAGGIVGQVRGHDTSTTIISNCYNDSSVKIIQDKNAAMGWWGCGGIYGDTANDVSTGIFVNNSYWNTTKCTRCGNNKDAHANSGKTVMSGVYDGWSADIWQFGSDTAPKLKWMA